jgi:hypothetical protein
VFIRFFKQTLGCRHLLSTKQQGVEIQVYAAVIACFSGRHRPTPSSTTSAFKSGRSRCRPPRSPLPRRSRCSSVAPAGAQPHTSDRRVGRYPIRNRGKANNFAQKHQAVEQAA